MDFIIKEANLNDLNQIMEIEKAGFIPEIQENEKTFRQRLTLCPQTFLIFQEQTSKKTAGYICGEYLQQIPQTPQELALGHSPKNQNSDSPIFYISSFSILPEYRGNGTGKKLWTQSLEYFSRRFSSPKKLILLVNQAWPAAQHIYETAGFHQIALFNNFFPTSEGTFSNGILMEK